MCGICGVVERNTRSQDAEAITKMTRTLSHRGPDDMGVTVSGAAHLGQTRLSILDLSARGHQPMTTGDGRYTLVYNGELYNFKELRLKLLNRGVQFVSDGDTEVVLQSLVNWGEDALLEFNGIFAIGFWDAERGTLLLARDRFGVKPLFYSYTNGSLLFGSEIKAILAYDAGSPTVSAAGLHEYLWYGNPLGPSTLFDGIRRLPPGHFLRLQADGMAVASYWDVETVPRVDDPPDVAIREVAVRLERAVQRQLVSDVPVGVFLSGGIDSSAITAFASKHYAGRLSSYSVGFDFQDGVNELPKARIVANTFDTDHQEIVLRGNDMPPLIERLVQAHDEPFGDAANLPLYLLTQQLSGRTKVILQGDGGDELFAGYRRYHVLG